MTKAEIMRLADAYAYAQAAHEQLDDQMDRVTQARATLEATIDEVLRERDEARRKALEDER